MDIDTKGGDAAQDMLEESVALNQLLLELYRRERRRRRILEALCVLCACAAIGAWLL